MRSLPPLRSVILAFMVTIAVSCDKDNPATPNATLPEVFTDKFASAITISVEGSFVVLKSTGVPDHKSPYFNSTDSRFEAYNGTNPNFAINPNKILTQNLTFKIPLSPAEASTKTNTALGPIGISVNGVPLYNQYAGPNQPLTNEINSFDQYNGHPQQSGQYHYHVEPLYITATLGQSALIGFLLDGFPVYGPSENGTILTSANLDTNHGHVSATSDYPSGIYHYHITADSPYINGGQYVGTAGTVTQ